MRKRTLLLAASTLAAALTTGMVTALPATTASAAPSGLSGDFDGDGYRDIAVGVPEESLGAKQDAGAVVVLRGSARGLTGTGAKSFSQNTSGVPGTAESRDFFGDAVFLPDVTGDRRAELIAGARGENGDTGG
ncbi:hypothetical protein C1I97_33690 [Streptomyces sp. NTH33]|uniref:FG-GAP repeat protein n=1 Tax=Streptomyces sp. NTH33 TaxID=1735453 RepID=UPI000DA71903|nr:FG-GAP repeat protein [Streptomyces sp. NTH33]PZG85194.1 hypothetical protein C1I97_33690 [Streptomyces sp. NTH33]